MYIVVSNLNKKPKELDGFQVELWTAQQFYDRASDENGLDIDEGIWYHTKVLSQDVYDALADFKDSGVDIVYFRYDTESPSEINIEGGEKVCVDPDKPVEVIAPEVEPTPEVIPPEPEIAPELDAPMRPGSMPTQEVVAEPEPVVEQPSVVEPTYSQPVMPTYQPQAPIEPTYQPVAQQPQPEVYQPQAPVMPQAPVAQQPIMPQAPVVQQPIAPQPQAPVYQPQAPQVPQSSDAQSNGIGLDIADDSQSGHGAIDKKVLTKNVRILDPSMETLFRKSDNPAKVILFGSAKGGTGKTFTACMSAYWFAKNHPELKIALADFDIIDGQVAISTNQIRPTVQGFYKEYLAGNKTFDDLYKYHANNDNFSDNLDFYLAPAQDIPEIVKDNKFWRTIFTLLIENYDVVFFDSGIDYMGTKPISELYKIASKIIITCNTSINSVNSIIKECLTLSGKRPNNIFSTDDKILDRTHIVLTRVSDEYRDVNEQVVASLTKYAPIIAAFGNIDGLIYRVQWGGTWNLIDEEPNITANLERITDLSEDE